MRHPADQYIGIPWDAYGDTREGVSCWGLVVLYYRELLNLEVPNYRHDVDDFAGIGDQTQAVLDSGEWFLVEKPEDGDVVLMSHRFAPHHFGIWVAGGALHASRFSRFVVHQTLAQLSESRFGRIRYMRKANV